MILIFVGHPSFLPLVRFLLTRQQSLVGLEQVSLRNTALYNDCPVKSETLKERPCPAYSVLYRTLDGTCNNVNNPDWGGAFRPFARFLPPDYRSVGHNT